LSHEKNAPIKTEETLTSIADPKSACPADNRDASYYT
jgi:hypothetical protein